ncbi:cytochrome c oxidase assembly factor 1 family protein [Flavobacterium sp. AC]|uniref:Cytochrome c oxidase assembly factor 1 family protein n=1 Tax=Flavobacterium azizsancarii TaxID=2961580 RepID=A0ABT4WBU0_9FLAO|nr:cytochrome c oxidase assembly factor Coa1 family protein [Flavobacterium azizsancarii]MDA6070054.1 cytochrome c oxidase assembly factor 1 family protein [Flavobacterium azizsancarii]
MEDDYVEVRKSWWERNWKWFVPTGCVSLLLIFVLFIVSIFFGVTSMMTNSDAYKEAMTKAQKNKVVIEKLGSPIEDDGMTSGSINTANGDSGNCDLQIPIKGPKGKATLFVVAEKKGTWKYSEMTVVIQNTKEEIDLLKK